MTKNIDNSFNILNLDTLKTTSKLEKGELFLDQSIIDKYTYIDVPLIGKIDKQYPPRIFYYENLFLYYNNSNKKDIFLSEEYYAVNFENNYYHILLDGIAPFLYFKEIIPNLKLLIIDSLDIENKLNIKYKKMIMDIIKELDIEFEFVNIYQNNVHIKKLYSMDKEYSSGPVGVSYPSKYFINLFSNVLIKKFRLNSNIKNKKIYISRIKSNGPRSNIQNNLINENDLEEIFKKNGFYIYYAEDYDFYEQRKIFSEASEIIGISGSGMVNALWCPINTKIINIVPGNGFDFKVYPKIAKASGANYASIEFNNIKGSQEFMDMIKFISNSLYM
jgi:hypothetical protein